MNFVLVIACLALAATALGEECTEVLNCAKCQNDGPMCDICPLGTVISKDGTECLGCGDRCGNCTNDGEDNVACTLCTSGHLEEGACPACTLDNCKLCKMVEDTEQCTECETPFVLKDGECTGCAAQKYADGDKCKSCPSNAESCSSGGVVSKCKDGYLPSEDNTKCLKCPTECETCSVSESTIECATCPDNQYVNDGGCDYCQDDNAGTKCKTCEENGECSACSDKYALKDGSCDACDANCKICPYSDGETVCEECLSSYGLNEGLTCTACPSNCASCTFGNGGATCTSCNDGYAVLSGSCEQCPSKCATCRYPTSNPTKGDEICETCEEGAYLALKKAGIAQCYALPTGCESLQTSGIAVNGVPLCETCVDGKFLNDAGACVVCTVTNCDDCTGDPAECVVDECADGYGHFADDNLCYSCTSTSTGADANCDTCDATAADTVECTACNSGYGLFADDDMCYSCTSTSTGADANCDTCDATAADTVECSACNSGYGLFADDNMCYSCTTGSTGADANCDTCDATAADTVECTACNSGYGLNAGDDMCYSCTTAGTGGSAHCDACDASAADTVTCTDCADGYVLLSGKCYDCPSYCTTCSLSGDDLQCSTCAPGYSPSYADGATDGGCDKCPSLCETCTADADGQTCQTCEDEAAINSEGLCEACSDNCDTCALDDDTVKCTDCKANYGLTAEKECVDCIEHCEECDDDSGVNKCTACKATFAINEEQCAACPSTNCLACDYDEGAMVCKTCAAKYVIKDGKCEKCPANCDDCSSTTKCNKGKCTTGFAQNSAGVCTDCATLTFANCISCEDHPGGNGTNDCNACGVGFVLEDSNHSGKDGECVDVTTLKCGAGVTIVDKAAECDADSCNAPAVITADKLCALSCIQCGTYKDGVFETVKDCPTENGTAAYSLCTVGACYTYKIEETDEMYAGCLPDGVSCDIGCQTANGKETCCCDDEENCNRLAITESHASIASYNLIFVGIIAILTKLIDGLY